MHKTVKFSLFVTKIQHTIWLLTSLTKIRCEPVAYKCFPLTTNIVTAANKQVKGQNYTGFLPWSVRRNSGNEIICAQALYLQNAFYTNRIEFIHIECIILQNKFYKYKMHFYSYIEKIHLLEPHKLRSLRHLLIKICRGKFKHI